MNLNTISKWKLDDIVASTKWRVVEPWAPYHSDTPVRIIAGTLAASLRDPWNRLIMTKEIKL